MKKVLIGFVMLMIATPVFAQEYTSNVWASFATVSSTQLNWEFPYNSRNIIIANTDTTDVVCVSFASPVTIGTGCGTTGTNVGKVMMVGPAQHVVIPNLVKGRVSLRAASGDVGFVSVTVNY